MSRRSLLDQRLDEFRKKYYTNQIIKGSLLLVLLISSILFIALLSEGIFGFSASVRTGIVALLGVGFAGVLGWMVIRPVSKLIKLAPGINDFQIADMVKSHFPEINDKLTNLLQLKSRSQNQELAMAAIDQKTQQVVPVKLSSAVDFSVNRKYLYYLLVPIGLYLIFFLANPTFLSQSGYRLVNFTEEFVPPPPFQINIEGVDQEMVAGEDFQVAISIEGDEIPQELFMFIRDDSDEGNQFVDYQLKEVAPGKYEYLLAEVKDDFSFFVGNEEVKSDAYGIDVLKRPYIRQFQATIQYPAYTGKAPEQLDPNVGDFKVLKGARVSWELYTEGDVAQAEFISEGAALDLEERDGKYRFSKRLLSPMEYYVSLRSEEEVQNVDTVKYKVGIVPDRFPSVYVFSPTEELMVDLDPQLPLELEIADDFGFSRMSLFYRFSKSGGTNSVTQDFQEFPLTIANNVLLQPLSYNIDLTQIGMLEGDEAEFFIKVWDNDGIAGPKASTSGTLKIVYPTLDAKYDQINEDQDQVREDLERLRENAKELQEAYQKMQEKLLEQKSLSFDDKKEMQRMIEEHKAMLDQIDQAQEQLEESKEQLEENSMMSEQTRENFEDLNKMMEELQNEEIEKLLEEIENKMENLDPEMLQDQLEQLKANEIDLKKSLERTLELLKQLEVQQKIDELRNKIDNLESKQELLNDQLENAETSEQLDEISERQENLDEQMEDIQSDLEELGDMKEETSAPDEEQMENLGEQAEETRQEMQEASENMEEASDSMEEGGRQNKKDAQQQMQNASESQQGAQQKLQEMSESLSSMQMQMQMQQDQQNLEDLRELLENLLKLSFDQEDLKEDVRGLSFNDPSLKERSQEQKKLQDDMGLIRDSLEALAGRMFQIEKFVLDESEKITGNMRSSQTFFRNKQVPMVVYHQQTAMTSVNNLANMLSDAMQQLQQQMKNAQAGQAMCPKPGENPSQMQSISKQQQQLNQMMQQMMEQGQQPNGEQMSQMAGQQERIRQQLEEAQAKMNGQGNKPMGDMQKVMQDMIESEEDLRNRQLTHETMMRQQQILSRLLQADQSIRERELDDQRESRTGRELERTSPDDLTQEEYQNRIRQELLKSNQLEYSPDFMILIEQYYKKLEGINE